MKIGRLRAWSCAGCSAVHHIDRRDQSSSRDPGVGPLSRRDGLVAEEKRDSEEIDAGRDPPRRRRTPEPMCVKMREPRSLRRPRDGSPPIADRDRAIAIVEHVVSPRPCRPRIVEKPERRRAQRNGSDPSTLCDPASLAHRRKRDRRATQWRSNPIPPKGRRLACAQACFDDQARSDLGGGSARVEKPGDLRRIQIRPNLGRPSIHDDPGRHIFAKPRRHAPPEKSPSNPEV